MNSKSARFSVSNSTQLEATLQVGGNAHILRESLPWSCITHLTINLTRIFQNRFPWATVHPELGDIFHQLRAVSHLSLQSTGALSPTHTQQAVVQKSSAISLEYGVYLFRRRMFASGISYANFDSHPSTI